MASGWGRPMPFRLACSLWRELPTHFLEYVANLLIKSRPSIKVHHNLQVTVSGHNALPRTVTAALELTPIGTRMMPVLGGTGDDSNYASWRHRQLKQGWYASSVGSAVTRCGEVLYTPIELTPLSREGPRSSTRHR
jgi:hypothetical protein